MIYYSAYELWLPSSKKSAPNSVHLIDHLISKSSKLHQQLASLQCQPHSLTERLGILEQFASHEQTVSNDPARHLKFYCAVAYKSLTDAFILTQRQAALRRIETSTNPIAKELLLKHLQRDQWISVGISHLTTSRQHLLKPVVCAKRTARGWLIKGTVPWVTAARGSKALVIAACDEDSYSEQYLFYLSMQNPAIRCATDMNLLALSNSCTCEVQLNDVLVEEHYRLHGPSENVMASSQTSGAGGLQTSALALGLAARVIDRIHQKSESITSLQSLNDNFTQRWMELYQRMMQASDTTAQSDPRIDTAKLRKDANDLVIRVTQSNLAIEKGQGYLSDSDASRWVCEALFFLVWSCPQTIANEHLCELSQFS